MINGLITGGAEVALARLLHAVDRSRFSMEVIALDPRLGPVATAIRRDGWPVRSVGLTQRGVVGGLPRLARLLRQSRPDVVQAWMYHAGLFAGIAARLSGSPPVAWNLRQSDLNPALNQRTTLLAARASARLSGVLPRVVVCGSSHAVEFHRRMGFASDKLRAIPNGIPLPSIDGSERDWLRRHLALDDDTLLVGRVGRFHAYKDYRGLVTAAAGVVARQPRAHFVLCGAGVDPSNAELAGWIRSAGVGDHLHLLGERQDVDRINAGLDLACSSSLGEGFPNVIAEAMAAATPVVATDVGDSAAIVGDCGWVVQPADPTALTEAILAALALPVEERRAVGKSARGRIASNFSISAMVRAYSELYESLAKSRP